MGKHSIIVIKNKKNEYLQYFDEIWNSYLFLNCKMKDKNDTDAIIKLLEEKMNMHLNNIQCVFIGEKTHKKFSEKDKVEKEFTHYFYRIDNLDIQDRHEFELFNIKYRWFSFEELENDERIQQVNSDIINYIKEFERLQ